MPVAFQPPLFDSLEGCDGGGPGPEVGLGAGLDRGRRIHLGAGA